MGWHCSLSFFYVRTKVRKRNIFPCFPHRPLAHRWRQVAMFRAKANRPSKSVLTAVQSSFLPPSLSSSFSQSPSCSSEAPKQYIVVQPSKYMKRRCHSRHIRLHFAMQTWWTVAVAPLPSPVRHAAAWANHPLILPRECRGDLSTVRVRRTGDHMCKSTWE